MTNSILVKNDVFYILVSDGLELFAEKDAAISSLKGELTDNEEATVAEITFDETEGEGMGTFEVEPISWRDIALGVVRADSE